jgi:hypothetical protein
MVISYSFSASCINDAIVVGLKKDLELFVINPSAPDPDGDEKEAGSPGRRPAFR